MGIPVSEKHGVNPMLVVCRWCGQETGEIALLGRLRGDKEAPRFGSVDDRPCGACEKRMEQGITFIEATRDSSGTHRTGRWWVIEDEAVKEMLNEDVWETVSKERKAMIPPELARMIGLYREEECESAD